MGTIEKTSSKAAVSDAVVDNNTEGPYNNGASGLSLTPGICISLCNISTSIETTVPREHRIDDDAPGAPASWHASKAAARWSGIFADSCSPCVSKNRTATVFLLKNITGVVEAGQCHALMVRELLYH